MHARLVKIADFIHKSPKLEPEVSVYLCGIHNMSEFWKIKYCSLAVMASNWSTVLWCSVVKTASLCDDPQGHFDGVEDEGVVLIEFLVMSWCFVAIFSPLLHSSSFSWTEETARWTFGFGWLAIWSGPDCLWLQPWNKDRLGIPLKLAWITASERLHCVIANLYSLSGLCSLILQIYRLKSLKMMIS